MALAREMKSLLFGVIPPLVGLALVAFFAWHTLHGTRGLIALAQIKEEIARARTELARLKAEQARAERRVSSLRPGSLDRDTLDERARVMLNLAAPDEIVIPYGPGRRLY